MLFVSRHLQHVHFQRMKAPLPRIGGPTERLRQSPHGIQCPLRYSPLLFYSSSHRITPKCPSLRSFTPCQKTFVVSLARLRHGPIVARYPSTLSSCSPVLDQYLAVLQPSADSCFCFRSKAQAQQVSVTTDVAWYVLE